MSCLARFFYSLSHSTSDTDDFDTNPLLSHLATDSEPESQHMLEDLCYACKRGDVQTVNDILDSETTFLATQKDKKGLVPLIYAIKGHHLDCIELMCVLAGERSMELACGDQMNRPLHYSVEEGNLQIVQCLQKHGCQLNSVNGSNMTPLHLCIEKNNVQIFNALVELGADVNIHLKKKLVEPLLITACKYGNNHLVNLLLKHKCDVECRDLFDVSALMTAALKGNYDIVLLLLNHGALIEAQSKRFHKFTALHFACTKNHEDICELLLTEYGANIDATDDVNRTPLIHAVIHGHISLARKLILWGADHTIADTIEQKTVMDYAREGQHYTKMSLVLHNAIQERHQENSSIAIQSDHSSESSSLRLSPSFSSNYGSGNYGSITPSPLSQTGSFQPSPSNTDGYQDQV